MNATDETLSYKLDDVVYLLTWVRGQVEKPTTKQQVTWGMCSALNKWIMHLSLSNDHSCDIVGHMLCLFTLLSRFVFFTTWNQYEDMNQWDKCHFAQMKLGIRYWFKISSYFKSIAFQFISSTKSLLLNPDRSDSVFL